MPPSFIVKPISMSKYNFLFLKFKKIRRKRFRATLNFRRPACFSMRSMELLCYGDLGFPVKNKKQPFHFRGLHKLNNIGLWFFTSFCSSEYIQRASRRKQFTYKLPTGKQLPFCIYTVSLSHLKKIIHLRPSVETFAIDFEFNIRQEIPCFSSMLIS